MLNDVSEDLDKREGGVVYNMLAPAALAISNLYISLDMVIDETFADTASYEYLIKRASEHGITPYEATKRTMLIAVSPDTGVVPVGAKFSFGGFTFTVIESDTFCTVECDTPGSEPNSANGNGICLSDIPGITRVTTVRNLMPGEDEESEEDFRKRFYSSINDVAFCGNIADYVQKTNAVEGVGATKVIRAWNGGGTVKLVILGSDYKVATDEVVARAQNEIDPVSGDGQGLAPIGHVVTVEKAQSTSITVKTKFTYENGIGYVDIKDSVLATLQEYCTELAKTWQDETNLVVRISQIESRLLEVQGIVDVSNTTLNDDTANIVIDEYKIPKVVSVIGI